MHRLCFLLGFALACGDDVSAPENTTPISTAEFARVLSDLVVARVELLPDTAAFLERRDVILTTTGVTVEELAGFVAARGADDDVMSTVYQRVETRLNALPGQTSPPPPP